MNDKERIAQPKDDVWVKRMQKKIALLSPENLEISAWVLEQLAVEQESRAKKRVKP
jgi:hypothetical protein